MARTPSGAFDLPGSAQDLTDGSSKALRDPPRSPKALPQTPKDPSEGPQDPLQASQGPFQDLLQTPRVPGALHGTPQHNTAPSKAPRDPSETPHMPPRSPKELLETPPGHPQDPLQALPRAPETPPGPKVLGSKCGIGHLSRPWLIPSSTLVSTPHAQDTKTISPTNTESKTARQSKQFANRTENDCLVHRLADQP